MRKLKQFNACYHDDKDDSSIRALEEWIYKHHTQRNYINYAHFNLHVIWFRSVLSGVLFSSSNNNGSKLIWDIKL